MPFGQAAVKINVGPARADIAARQAALDSKRHEPVAIGGEFDASTKAALRKFHVSCGMKAQVGWRRSRATPLGGAVPRRPRPGY